MFSAARVRSRFGDRVSPTSSSWSPLRPSVVDPPYLVLTPAACRSLAFDFFPPCRPSPQLGSSRPRSLACPPAVTPRVAFATLPAHVACRLLRRLGALLQVCLHLRPGAIGVVSAPRSLVAFHRSGSRPRSGLVPRVFPVAYSVLRGSLSSAPWRRCRRLSLVPVPVSVAGCSRPAELPRFVCCRRSRLRVFSANCFYLSALVAPLAADGGTFAFPCSGCSLDRSSGFPGGRFDRAPLRHLGLIRRLLALRVLRPAAVRSVLLGGALGVPPRARFSAVRRVRFGGPVPRLAQPRYRVPVVSSPWFSRGSAPPSSCGGSFGVVTVVALFPALRILAIRRCCRDPTGVNLRVDPDVCTCTTCTSCTCT